MFGLLPASAAERPWSVLAIPGPSYDFAVGPSCPSVHWCAYLVSSRSVHAPPPSLVVWDGSRWSASVPLPVPVSGILHLDCPAVGTCMTIGATFSQHPKPVVQEWRGGHWSVLPTPALPGPSAGSLGRVSCYSAFSCIAIGDKVVGDNLVPIAEAWDGKHWSLEPLAGGMTSVSGLGGVSCLSARWCLATFSDPFLPADPKWGFQGGLVELWDGRSWSKFTMPHLAAEVGPHGGASEMGAISCTSTSWCAALTGDYTPVVEAWDGHAWHTTKLVEPAKGTYFGSISCTGRHSCFVSGNTPTGPRRSLRPLFERWNGIGWAVMPSAIPANWVDDEVGGIACGHPLTCFASLTAYDGTGIHSAVFQMQYPPGR